MKKISIRIESRDIDSEGVHFESQPEGSYHRYEEKIFTKKDMNNAIIFTLERFAALLKNDS